MSARLNELGELQLAVMNILWSCRQATVHEVLERLTGGEKKPAYTTVLTVLRNLEKRGLVAHEAIPGTRMYRYRPLVSAHDARDDILQDVLNRLFAGSPARLICHLLETEGFSPAEIKAIRTALETLERKVSEKSAL